MNTHKKTYTVSTSASAPIQAPPEAVWRALGEFSDWHKWNADLKECSRDTEAVQVGTIRTCVYTKPFLGVEKAIETLTEYTPGTSLTYQGNEPTGPFLAGGSKWEIDPLSEGTELRVTTTVTLGNIWIRIFLWWLLALGIRSSIKKYAKQLEAYVLKTV